MAALINLHKFGILPDDEDTHVFTFIFENPARLLEIKSVESSEVTYGGHRWSVVCMRKEEKFVGIYLKWRYSDGQSAAAISAKAKYTLSIIHRQDYNENKYFASNQKFTTSQSLLGKSKFIALDDLLDQGEGYLDETGKRVVVELTISKCSTRYERTIDISPKARTKKNVSGFYFDTTTFLVANNRWYLRVYPTKSNSNGLPAVYLYLATKPKGLSIEVTFRLYVGDDTTELLSYNYGEGAKYDGFGKTLSQPLYNPEKLQQLTVGAEVTSIIIWKDLVIPLRAHGGMYSPQVYKESYNSYKRGQQAKAGGSYSSLTAAEAFLDHEGNYWKADLDRESRKLTIVFDKGVHHYQQNKTKLLCWSMTLLSRDPDRANDLDQCGEPVVGYFSNFIDEKGYRMSFPVEIMELEEKDSPYTHGSNELVFRVNMLSLQTVPLGMRSVPRFDYQARHLLRARRLLHENSSNLANMREMNASRASLSFLDTSRDDRVNSETSSNSGFGFGNKLQMYKSYDSLDDFSRMEMLTDDEGLGGKRLSTGDMIAGDDDFGKGFFTDLLRHIAIDRKSENNKDEPFITGRDLFNGTREDVSTESGVTVSEESSLLMEARPSPVDLGRQKEMVSTLIKLLQQRLPFRITEALEFGSLGSGTSTRSRMDVDLILFSPDLPCDGQHIWMPSLLHAVQNFIMNAHGNPDPFYPLPNCEYFSQTECALQFTCGGVDVDIMFSYDWGMDELNKGGYNTVYDITCKTNTKKGRHWYALATSKLQKKFVSDQPNEVKEIIKVVKHWRNCVQWKKTSHRPNSYLISLLVIKAAEDTRSFDMKKVLHRMGALVMAPELKMSWSKYYLPDKYPVDFDPPCPLVRDPANPGVNVADSLPYWGQFRSELSLWFKSLAISIGTIDS